VFILIPIFVETLKLKIMGLHYELTEEFKINALGVKLFRIRATKKSKYADIGDLGGWIESAYLKNGNARVYGDAWVYGDAEVSGNARVYGDAWVYGNARVSGNARVYGDAEVSGNARVYGDAEVSGNAWVYGDARVYGDAEVSGNAWVYGDADIKTDNDICWFSKFGSSNRTTTFFKSKDGIKVVCGCFFGNLLEFSKKVKETHSGNKFEKEYLLMIELAKTKLL